ncbi:MAG TPA: hypothetical protein PLL36_08360 [Candidatus Hydrogenedentes bacterium]|nr:hypothetical protein [Candidatus Hydrogenedentota bacterium]
MNHDTEMKAIAIDAEEIQVALDHLKNRIVNVIPPGTEYLEILLKLSEIQWTETISTAAHLRRLATPVIQPEVCGPLLHP